LLEFLSGGSGILLNLLVQAEHLGELADGGLTDFLVSLVLGVHGVLSIIVGLLQVIEQLED
jgi:hypothetical protein